jgi:hypothetical protein
MKIVQNLNNVMHAHDSLFIHCEAYHLLHYYDAYPRFIIMRLTLSSVNVFMLYALEFIRYTPILCKSCFLQI